ncbi:MULTISPECIES: hypothetical protein [Aerococcus]|uniref:hypothetical protein n=1 Tax=Aerococcus TaxID=1375 RepID=UPI003B20C75A
MDNNMKIDIGTLQRVVIDKMNLFYMEVPNNPESQKKAWPLFEVHFPSLTGRKMFGLDYDENKVYRVCSVVLESDRDDTYGLNQFEFEGGNYLRLRLKYDVPELYEKISPAYDFLFSQYGGHINWSLPMIEHYKSKNILDIMIPINE